jgi:hypothetical protein
VCAVETLPIGGMAIYTGYLYNAQGQRMAKGTLTSFSCNMALNSNQLPTNGFAPNAAGEDSTESVLGQGGEQLAEVALDENGAMEWLHTNVYSGGALIATYDTNGLHFLLPAPSAQAWLGTRRAQTDYAGVVEQTCQSHVQRRSGRDGT